MSNPTPKKQLTEREVPKEVRFFTSGFVFRKFTVGERIRIALGCNLAAQIHIATEQRPGLVKPLVTFSVTAMDTAELAMREIGETAKGKKIEI
jgi:hypothetical protein